MFSVWAALTPVQVKHLRHAAVQASPALFTAHFPISATETQIMQPEMPFVTRT